jgi:ABC-2 type transport system ATP-binding protein
LHDPAGIEHDASMQQAFLEVRDLSKSYGSREAVRGVSFSVARGEIVGLLGPNGAGKSTLISMLTGLRSPSSGEILWEGQPIRAALQAWRRSLGAVLEDLALFEYLTGREHLRLAGQLYGYSLSETERRTKELISFFDLGDHADTPAAEASQGTRKKIAFALGVIHAPAVLLLDEALNGIDALTVSRIKTLLRRMAAGGTTVLISSHVLDAVESLIGRCMIVDRGRVVLDDSMQAIKVSGKSLEQIYTSAIEGDSRAMTELSWVG